MKDLYTAHVLAIAGRQGSARSDDGRLELALALPTALGGDGKGVNPEQLFAAGFAGCFASSVQFVARERKLDVGGVEVGATVTLGAKEDGGYGLRAILEITMPGISQAERGEIVSAAQQICAYSNATRGNVETEYRIKS